MRLFPRASAMTLFLCLACLVEGDSHTCGHRNETETRPKLIKRIVGGGEANRNSWPWIVNFIDAESRQECSGSIIGREWILTAAHCVLLRSDSPYQGFTFHFADHQLNVSDPGEYTVPASKFFVHPKAVLGTATVPGDYDIALVQLSHPLNYSEKVQPICLIGEHDNFSHADLCYLAGWRDTKRNAISRSPVLKEAKLDLVDLKECNSNTPYKGAVPPRSICAGFKEGGIDGCTGDSGAPLQCYRNGSWIQVGIMIWGSGCAQPNYYGIYSDVKVFLPFIRTILSGANSNLTSYHMKTLMEVRNGELRTPYNLYDLLTNDGEFSDVDLVRNLQLTPFQIRLANKTTLMDLVFVSHRHGNLSGNSTMLEYIASAFINQTERLRIYSMSLEVMQEFNVTFQQVLESVNLTKDEFLDSKPAIITNITKRYYVQRYIVELGKLVQELKTYKRDLNVTFNETISKNDLDQISLDNLRKLERKSLKKLIAKQNQMIFLTMLTIHNISSFFETNVDHLMRVTVTDILTEYLSINLNSFASMRNLTNEELDVLRMVKISAVHGSENHDLYAVIRNILGTDIRFSVCGMRKSNKNLHTRKKRVIGGSEAAENSWPWMVNFLDPRSRQQCAGSIIDRKWILTAAHCYDRGETFYPQEYYSYHVGDHNYNVTDPHEYKINASKVFIHPRYVIASNTKPGDYDIALIELQKPLTYSEYVRPVCLIQQNNVFSMNDECYVSGWGNDKNVTTYHRSLVLKEARINLVSREECNSDTSYKGVITDRFICAGFKQGGTDACFGDSGGPFQCKRNGSWIQIGLVSWGIGCAEPNHYGVYSNVRRLLPFVDAIRSGPNSMLASYLNQTLNESLPNVMKRSSKNLFQLFTADYRFTDVDLVRNLQLNPTQIKTLNESTLGELSFVSNSHNLTANRTILNTIIRLFMMQTNRLSVYKTSKEVSRQLNITFEEIVLLSELTRDAFLNSKKTIFDKVMKAFYVKQNLAKLRAFKESLASYNVDLNLTLDDVRAKNNLDMFSLNDNKNMSDHMLKQVLVRQNRLAFTGRLTIRNITAFFGLTRENLVGMSVPDVLAKVLNISHSDFLSLHMLNAQQFDMIKDEKISTVTDAMDQTLFQIVKAIFKDKEMTNRCGSESRKQCSSNAVCIDLEFSFSCRCRLGYIGDGFTCSTGNKFYSSELRINEDFKEAFNNPASSEYIMQAKRIEDALTYAINISNNFQGFVGAQVTGFKRGSVIVQFVLVFQRQDSVDLAKLASVVRRTVQNGSLSANMSKPLILSDICSLESRICHTNATCKAKNGRFVCECNKNLYGNGIDNCVDPCAPPSCPKNSDCFRLLNGERACICAVEYARQESGDCEKKEDYKTALIAVSCVAGTLLLLALLFVWCQYCNSNRKRSAEINGSKAANGRQNTAFDGMNMDRL